MSPAVVSFNLLFGCTGSRAVNNRDGGLADKQHLGLQQAAWTILELLETALGSVQSYCASSGLPRRLKIDSTVLKSLLSAAKLGLENGLSRVRHCAVDVAADGVSTQNRTYDGRRRSRDSPVEHRKWTKGGTTWLWTIGGRLVEVMSSIVPAAPTPEPS